MTSRATRHLIHVTLLALIACPLAAVDGVSPGEADRFAQAPSACPSFSWELDGKAAFYELAVYAIAADNQLAEATSKGALYSKALSRQLPGKATSWSPSASECFAAGSRYVWFVRAIYDDATSDWSRGRYFSTPAGPTLEEVQRALAVLDAWQQNQGAERIVPEASPAAAAAVAPELPAAITPPATARDVSAGLPAIRGEQPDLTGETYGVVGITASAEGAGVGAVNLDRGPDLVLDGRASGTPSTEFFEWGIDRPDGADQTFTFRNTGAGDLALEVDGPMTATLFRGDGSGLTDVAAKTAVDADMLDGQHGPFFLDLGNMSAGTLAYDRFNAYGDLEDERYLDDDDGRDLLLRDQADARFVNLAGDTMTGALTIDMDGSGLLAQITASDESLEDVLKIEVRDTGGKEKFSVDSEGDIAAGSLLARTTGTEELAGDVVKIELRDTKGGALFSVDSEGDVAGGNFTGDGAGLTNITSSDLFCNGCVGSLELENGGVSTLDVADASITSGKLAANAVTSAKIADDSVREVHIGPDAVTPTALRDGAVITDKLADGAVTSAKIATGAVTTNEILDTGITNRDLAPDSVRTEHIKDGEVVGADVRDGSIGAVDLAADAVTSAKIAAGAVGSAEILDGGVATVDLANGAVTSAKIATGAVDGVHVATGAITTAQIATHTIASFDMADESVDSRVIKNWSIKSDDIDGGAVGSVEIANGSIKYVDVDTGEIQRRITGICDAGSSIRMISSTGTVTCEDDSGGVSTIIAGTGLSGGGSTDTVSLAVAVPLTLQATLPNTEYSLIKATDAGAGIGVHGSAAIGVKGEGSSNGGVFSVSGSSGTGIVVHGPAVSGSLAARLYGNVSIKDPVTFEDVIELGKGLDYAEGFDVVDGDLLEPGSVLSIDPEHPGNLRLSDEAYDTRVVGIIAGANGLGSGIRLGAGGFDHDVALAGRVYCNVDATDAGIEPGDLLTTSALPGYAMKAIDPNLSRGAILGKAMEPLTMGQTGRILVLVTLQ